MTDRNCVIGDKPHAAGVGLLCERHFARLAAMLRDVEDQAAMLTAVPSMQIASGSRGGSLASHRSPARLDVIVANDRRRGTGIPLSGEPDPWGFDDTASVLDVLGSWARVVREERNLQPPDSVTVTGERDLLTRQLDWVAEQPWVDEAFDDLRKLLGQLKGANGTQDEKPVGRCYLPAEEGPCNGPVWMDTAMGHANCGRCKATWDGPQLAMLSWELEQMQAEANRPKTADGRPLFTAAEIARDLGKSVNAVRLQLSKLRVKAAFGSYYDRDVLTRQAS